MYKSSIFLKKINELLLTSKLIFAIEQTTNKITINNSNTLATTSLINSFKPTVNAGGFITAIPTITYPNYFIKILTGNKNFINFYGIKNDSELSSSLYTAENNINFTNFSKLYLCSNLLFTIPSHNDIITINNNSGIGDVILSLDNDEIPFSYIKYINNNSLQNKLSNKIISNIKFRFFNDKSQIVYLNDVVISFQIIKSKK